MYLYYRYPTLGMDHSIFDGGEGGVAEIFGCSISFPWSLTLHDTFLARHFLA